MAELLRNNKQGNARIRVESVLLINKMLHAYDIIELFLELLAVSRDPPAKQQFRCNVTKPESTFWSAAILLACPPAKPCSHPALFVACPCQPGAPLVFNIQLPVRQFGSAIHLPNLSLARERSQHHCSPHVTSLCKILPCNTYAQPLTRICDGAERLDCSLVPSRSPAALMAKSNCRCGRLWWSRPPRSLQTCARP